MWMEKVKWNREENLGKGIDKGEILLVFVHSSIERENFYRAVIKSKTVFIGDNHERNCWRKSWRAVWVEVKARTSKWNENCCLVCSPCRVCSLCEVLLVYGRRIIANSFALALALEWFEYPSEYLGKKLSHSEETNEKWKNEQKTGKLKRVGKFFSDSSIHSFPSAKQNSSARLEETSYNFLCGRIWRDWFRATLTLLIM